MPVLRVILPAGRALGLFPKVRFFTPDELVESHRLAGFEILHRWQPGRKQALCEVWSLVHARSLTEFGGR